LIEPGVASDYAFRRLDELWVELWAIRIWDQTYALQPSSDEIDTTARVARRLRSVEILTALDRLRTWFSHSARPCFSRQSSTSDEGSKSPSLKIGNVNRVLPDMWNGVRAALTSQVQTTSYHTGNSASWQWLLSSPPTVL
jgi:hypothetical protein